MLDGKKPRDPISTKPDELFDENFLMELDKACTTVSAFIVIEQNSVSEGSALGVRRCSKLYKVYRKISAIELKKFKKEFLSLSKLHPPKKAPGKNQTPFEDSFVQFLNSRQ